MNLQTKWQHERISQDDRHNVYLDIRLAGQYISLTKARYEGENCVLAEVTKEPTESSKRIGVNGKFNVPIKMYLGEYISIEKEEGKSCYLLRKASDWQLKNERKQRNVNRPTGWVQKNIIITVREADINYLRSDPVLSIYSKEEFGEHPKIILQGFSENPGKEWKCRDNDLRKLAFNVSAKYRRYIGLEPCTQLTFQRVDGRLEFDAPNKCDAITGRPVNETKERVTALSIKKEAANQLPVLREYVSQTDTSAPLHERLQAVINLVNHDQSLVEELANSREFKQIMKRRTV